MAADQVAAAEEVSDQMMSILKAAMDSASLQSGENGDEGGALLTMTRTERTIFGHTQLGEVQDHHWLCKRGISELTG